MSCSARAVHALRLGVCALLLSSACLRQAEDRALGDLDVGIASAGDVSFAVRDGLAHVLSASPGALTLRAQAPVLRVSAISAAASAGTWVITVENCMPDAELSAEADGVALAVVSRPEGRVTVRSWEVELPAAAESLLTIAPPDFDRVERFRFAVLSDIQQGLSSVDDLFERINREDGVRMVLSTGDLVEDGTASELDVFERKLETLTVPFYSTVGNHDLWDGPTEWRRRFGRFSMHFDFKGASFSLVDSASATIDPLVYEWLDDWLVDARDRLHIVLTHIPPLDPVGVRSGSFRSRREANKFLARLAAGGVDLTLYGHIHSHYAFTNAGIPAHISGGGGAWQERLDGIGRHFLVVDVAPDAAPAVTVVEID